MCDLSSINTHNHRREFLGSYPDGVMAIRISASQSGKLNVKCSLSRTNWVTDQFSAISNSIVGSNTIILKANSGQSSGAITFTSEARVVNNGGVSTYHNKGLF